MQIHLPTILGALVIGVLLGVLGTLTFTSKAGSTEETIVTIDSIREVAKLATIDYHGSISERVTRGHEWYEWKNAELFVEIHGTVEGLIDLEKITMQSSGEPKSVVIAIPPDAVEIRGPVVDSDQGIKVTTLHDPNVFHKLTDAQRDAAVNHGLAQLKQKAIDSGIKAKTLEEAKQVIRQFLAAAGAEVVFPSS